MNVLVAGGTGFVGSHVAEAMLRAGHSVRSLARRPPATERNDAVEYVVGDLGNLGDSSRAFAGIDVAIFAVTTTTPGSASADASFDLISNVVNAIHFLEGAAAGSVGHVLVISSGGTVYGVPETLPIPEDHPTNPISAYGVTKLAVENYFALHAYQTDCDVTVLRVGNAYGERQDARIGQGAPAAFLSAILARQPVELWGDGSTVRDYVYVGDVARACVIAVEARPAAGRLIVNIGSGSGRSLLELLAACARVTGAEPVVEHRPGRRLDVPEVVLDVRRAAATLGWVPETSFEDGLQRQASWLARG